MSLNSLLIDSGSKGWADLFIYTLKVYNGATFCGDKVKRVHKYNFNVGDVVRKKLKRGVFDKGYERRWTKRVYKIIDIDNDIYVLDDDSIMRGDEIQAVSDIKYDEKDDFIENETKQMKIERIMKREPAFKNIDVNKQIRTSKRTRRTPTRLNL